MPAFRLTLAYDGTGFEGWQSQSRGSARTVQGEVESALRRLSGGERVALCAAGRTDSGVHALGQVVSFSLDRGIQAGDLLRALNGMLPHDVRVLEAALAPESFHARRSARSKLYRYLLDTGPLQLPTRRPWAGHTPWRLDEARVREAAGLYIGRHDFASVASAGGSALTTIRTVTRSEARFLEPEAPGPGPTLLYEVEADGFLRRMVRSLVGGLVAAGRGAVSVADLRRALEARDRRAWPPPAEARGLALVRVDYPPEALVLR
jgi:tRNA pseudouridine38-40 synthase